MAEPDHFELVPKTPHSARKRTPAKPLLYADEPVSAAIQLPASPTIAATTATATATDFKVSEYSAPTASSPREPKKPTVFERLFHIKGDPTATAKRSKTAVAPRPSTALPPARSKKPLTVPEEFHFRTDQRIAMKRHDNMKEETKQPKATTKRPSSAANKPQTIKTPKQARTLTVPVSPVFASDKRAAMRKH